MIVNQPTIPFQSDKKVNTNQIKLEQELHYFMYEITILQNTILEQSDKDELQDYFDQEIPNNIYYYPFVYFPEPLDYHRFEYVFSRGLIVSIKLQLREELQISSQTFNENLDSKIKQFYDGLSNKFMKITKFLYCQYLKACFNPFQQVKINEHCSQIPGCSIQIPVKINDVMEKSNNKQQTWKIFTSMYIVPIIIQLRSIISTPLSSLPTLLLDRATGNFLLKEQIVRVDKSKSLIYFKDNRSVQIETLCSIKLINPSGFEMTKQLVNYWKRLQQQLFPKMVNNSLINAYNRYVGSQFLAKWRIGLDRKFVDLPYNFQQIGKVVFRNNIERPLIETVIAVSKTAYNHYITNFYQGQIHGIQGLDAQQAGVMFDGVLKTQIIFFIPEQFMSFYKNDYRVYANPIQTLLSKFQQIINRMKLQVRFKVVQVKKACYTNFEDMLILFSEVIKSNQTIHTFLLPSEDFCCIEDSVFSHESYPVNLRKIKLWLIERGIYFHFIKFPFHSFNLQQSQALVMAYRHISILYSKLCINAWKIKQIPYGERAAVVISLDVRKIDSEKCSVAMVCTMNSFYSKFTAIRRLAKCKSYSDPNEMSIQATETIQSNYYAAIWYCLRECLKRFCQQHKIYPFRVFVYRTGWHQSGNKNLNKSIELQYTYLRNQLTNYYSSKQNVKMNTLTQIGLTTHHMLRCYSQHDPNVLRPQFVKKIQLLTNIVLDYQFPNDFYIQLEQDEPMHKLQIIEMERDPGFIQKIILLTCKIVFGTPGNQYGSGLGLVGYGAKLNQYREFNLSGWLQLLRQGKMLFL